MSNKNNTEKLLATLTNSPRVKIDLVAVGQKIKGYDEFNPRALRIRRWELLDRDTPKISEVTVSLNQLTRLRDHVDGLLTDAQKYGTETRDHELGEQPQRKAA